jgi:hypothetical protein
MRLLHCQTLDIQAFFGKDTPVYAILSHTWGNEEVLFEEWGSERCKHKAGYEKIVKTCELARQDGYEYAWIDTCCIDKRSSSELSEAINSMFRWYAEAAVCYVLLEDVRAEEMPQAKWFTRGWTLQELIAPREVEFFDYEWQPVGTRSSLIKELSRITGIDEEALQGHTSTDFIREASIAKRMSWAAGRETTRKEDEAYCLLGLLGVQIPLQYGEREQAFQRLQEEIMRVSTDQSIFAWAANEQQQQQQQQQEQHRHQGQLFHLLADSPRKFRQSANTQTIQDEEQSFQLTNRELLIRVPVYQVAHMRNMYIAVLACSHRCRVGILLKTMKPMDGALLRRVGRLAGLPLVNAESQSPTFVRASSLLLPVDEKDRQAARLMSINILRAPAQQQNLRKLRIEVHWGRLRFDHVRYRSDEKELSTRETEIQLEPSGRMQYAYMIKSEKSFIAVQVCVPASDNEKSRGTGQSSTNRRSEYDKHGEHGRYDSLTRLADFLGVTRLARPIRLVAIFGLSGIALLNGLIVQFLTGLVLFYYASLVFQLGLGFRILVVVLAMGTFVIFLSCTANLLPIFKAEALAALATLGRPIRRAGDPGDIGEARNVRDAEDTADDEVIIDASCSRYDHAMRNFQSFVKGAWWTTTMCYEPSTTIATLSGLDVFAAIVLPTLFAAFILVPSSHPCSIFGDYCSTREKRFDSYSAGIRTLCLLPAHKGHAVFSAWLHRLEKESSSSDSHALQVSNATIGRVCGRLEWKVNLGREFLLLYVTLEQQWRWKHRFLEPHLVFMFFGLFFMFFGMYVLFIWAQHVARFWFSLALHLLMHLSTSSLHKLERGVFVFYVYLFCYSGTFPFVRQSQDKAHRFDAFNKIVSNVCFLALMMGTFSPRCRYIFTYPAITFASYVAFVDRFAYSRTLRLTTRSLQYIRASRKEYVVSILILVFMSLALTR